jgi:DnaJ-class molecular chaperone
MSGNEPTEAQKRKLLAESTAFDEAYLKRNPNATYNEIVEAWNREHSGKRDTTQCEKCHGSGEVLQGDSFYECATCNGTGRAIKQIKV